MGTELDSKLKLYVRLPVRIDEELQVKELHPDIEKIVLPRQKSRKWCFVVFRSVETLRKVKKALKEKRINGRKIVVAPYKQRKIRPKKKTNKKDNTKTFFIDTEPLLFLLDTN